MRCALLRCMLSAGLLGSTLAQPGTVHRMLVRTWHSSVTDGRTSSRAGAASPPTPPPPAPGGSAACPGPAPRRAAAAILVSGARPELPPRGTAPPRRHRPLGVTSRPLPLRHAAGAERGRACSWARPAPLPFCPASLVVQFL